MKYTYMWAILENDITRKPIVIFKSKHEANKRLRQEIEACNFNVLFRKIKVKVPEHNEVWDKW